MRNYVEGLEDFGMACGRTEKPGNHATVFIARGLIAKWKQPFGYFLSHSTKKSADLHRLDDNHRAIKVIRLDNKGSHLRPGVKQSFGLKEPWGYT
ncbi:hypothetical protein ElyMa_000049800 [Elysia marginata]|uniref:Transposable element P transposase-like RNase H domain-containing protein n=1 Tax=Elysia marginata TaxID=1093978 RepID=A0AAV4EDP3_9GAST|nr:hypothetical protein ElyMa_000049800 [Elysia marginata]